MSLFCAVVLAGVFAVSAREKTGRTRFRVFAAGAGPLELLARRWRTAAAVAVAAAEVVVVAAFAGGLVLVLAGLGSAMLVGAFVVSAALLAVFTAAIGLAVAFGALVAVLAVRLDDLVALFSPPRPARPLR